MVKIAGTTSITSPHPRRDIVGYQVLVPSLPATEIDSLFIEGSIYTHEAVEISELWKFFNWKDQDSILEWVLRQVGDVWVCTVQLNFQDSLSSLVDEDTKVNLQEFLFS